MSNQWFRSWHGAPTDPKWLGIARKAGVAPGIVAAVVWALLDRASQAEQRGSIAGYDADGISCFMGCEPEEVQAIITQMHEKGVLEDDAFTGWEKHQPKREDNSSDRVKAYRERLKTQSNATVTQCNAGERAETLDTDTDTDTEREKSALAEDPRHWKVAHDFLTDRAPDLSDWEIQFLHSIKWAPDLTKTQAASLKAIEGKLTAKANPVAALPSVKRGTPQFEAWVAHYRARNGGRPTFHESRDSITVPSEYPPVEEKAA